MFNLNVDKVDFDGKIASGYWGTVYPYKKTGGTDDGLVVKHLVTSNIDAMLKNLNEIVLGFSCDHPNVLSVKGYNITYEQKQRNWNTYLKMPRMRESLKNKMTRLNQQTKYLAENELVQHFYSLCSGLAYLHNRSISHKDIKPDNILIDSQGQLKIADIGIGELIDEQTSYYVQEREGTAGYLAPEVLDRDFKLKKRDLFKTDAWSLGVVMVELCVMKSSLVNVLESGEVKEAVFEKVLDEVRLRYSEELVGIIKSLLKADPKQRKSVKEVKSILEAKYKKEIENCKYGDVGDLQEKNDQLQKDLKSKETFIIEVEKRYQDIVADLENKLGNGQEELEDRNKDLKKFQGYIQDLISLDKNSNTMINDLLDKLDCVQYCNDQHKVLYQSEKNQVQKLLKKVEVMELEKQLQGLQSDKEWDKHLREENEEEYQQDDKNQYVWFLKYNEPFQQPLPDTIIRVVRDYGL